MALVGFLEISLAFIFFVFLRCLRVTKGYRQSWPFVGWLPSVFLHLNKIHSQCTKILESSPSNTFMLRGFCFTGTDILITANPANIHYIMTTNFANYPKGPKFNEIFEILGKGIFNSDFHLWRDQRKMAQALMNHRNFLKFVASMSQNKVETGLVPILEYVAKQGLVVDIQDLFQRFTFDSTCNLITGYDPKCLTIEFPEVPFPKALDDAEEALFYRHIMPESFWKLQKFLGIGEAKKLSNAWSVLDKVIAGYIVRKRQELNKGSGIEENEEVGVDLLTSYMNIAESEMTGSKSNNDQVLRDTVLNLLIAGRDTTASALSWFFWLVTKNPCVANIIREELKSKIPPKDACKWRVFSIEEVKQLSYLHAALCESLRLYPPVPFQHKSPTQPDILPSGHHVDTKMKVIFPLYALGRMTSVWGEDSLEFRPERWISDRGSGVKHMPSYKFLAFNAGPRTCLGKEVAFTQMKLVAANIIHNYQIEVVEGHPVVPSVSIILHMKNGLRVRVKKIWT